MTENRNATASYRTPEIVAALNAHIAPLCAIADCVRPKGEVCRQCLLGERRLRGTAVGAI